MENNTNQNNVDANSTSNTVATTNKVEENKEEITLEELQRRRDEEREKKRQEVINNYKPLSNFKSALLVIFFILLIGYVWFLPDINKQVKLFFDENKVEEKITTGTLECTFNRSTANLDIEYESVFAYSDNKLSKFTYTVVTRGDADLDEDALEKTNSECERLKKVSDEFDGVKLSCSYTHDRVVATQVFDYNDIDAVAVSSAFVEAGGTYPEFKKGQNIDKIEDIMKTSQYACKRVG